MEMQWNKLLSSKRYGLEKRVNENHELKRTLFQRDYDRLIFSSPFRRLQNKTQVFPLPGSVFVHNRLTHSLEVSCVGRSLGNLVSGWLLNQKLIDPNSNISEIGTIVSTACLAHDLGNPPFGHSGEESIGNYFLNGDGKNFKNQLSDAEYLDFAHFEGNANALRVLTHQFYGRRFGGYALTYVSLASIVKYPCDSINGHDKTNICTKKYGFFQSEKETFNTIAQELGLIKNTQNPTSFVRHPLVYLVEAADDICYNIIDLEDAHRLAIVDFEVAKNLLLDFFSSIEKKQLKTTLNQLKHDKNEQLSFLRANVISKLIYGCVEAFTLNYSQIMNGTYNSSLTDSLNEELKNSLNNIQVLSVSDIYKHRSVVEIEIAGYKVLGYLLQEFVAAVMYSENKYSKMLLQLVPKQYTVNQNTPYEKIMGIVDFISGMTDVFAVDLYKKIKGESLQLS